LVNETPQQCRFVCLALTRQQNTLLSSCVLL
jgi:hypothetical protein